MRAEATATNTRKLANLKPILLPKFLLFRTRHLNKIHLLYNFQIIKNFTKLFLSHKRKVKPIWSTWTLTILKVDLSFLQQIHLTNLHKDAAKLLRCFETTIRVEPHVQQLTWGPCDRSNQKCWGTWANRSKWSHWIFKYQRPWSKDNFEINNKPDDEDKKNRKEKKTT